MSKHQDAPQLRATRHGRGGTGRCAAGRAQVSGSAKPSKANEAVFARAVDEIAHVTSICSPSS